MSKMAKCLRLALSASNKIVRCHSGVQFANTALPRFTTCQLTTQRHVSAAVLLPKLVRFTPLAAVKPCTCSSRRLLQTDVDKELSKFLDKEISYEESSDNKKPLVCKFDGFEVTTDDADIMLTRKAGTETVIIKFNVNGTVDSAGGGAAEAEMVSLPPFTVELCKGDGTSLSLQCTHVSAEDDQEDGPQDAEAIVDSFEIQEVALHSGEWKDTVYSVTADIMDGNLYDLLMDMLDERGINEDFINQLVEFSTNYEHGRYVDFLKKLKSFAEK